MFFRVQHLDKGKYESESMEEMIHEMNQTTLNYGYGINS